FLRAYKQLHRWEARSSFGTWLFRIAANYSLDLMRKRKRHGEVTMNDSGPDEESTEMAQVLPSSDPGPDRLMFSNRVQARVSEALAELSQQERTAFVLRHFEGQSIEEISAALGLSGNAAKHSIFRAVQKLRRHLEPLVGTTA